MRIAIIGAGVAGLCAARRLNQAGMSVSLFDKSRGVGGRLSTRYAGDFEFDHGAQYFTVKDPEFEALVQDAFLDKSVERWSGRALYLKKGLLTTDTGAPRWVGAPRMNSFAKFLAKEADVNLGHAVTGLKRETDNRWTLSFDESASPEHLIQDRTGFDAVICTAPPVQAQAILPSNFSESKSLKHARLDACFALMIGLHDPINVGWDSLRVSDLPVAWLAVNSSKPGRRSDLGALMVHAAPEWSNENKETDRDEIQNTLLTIASSLTRLDLTNPAYLTLHRWLYASVAQSPERPCLYDKEQNLIAAGDWCLGGRVEGAALSGLAAAHALIEAV